MKKIYKAPETEVVKIKLVGSVLEETGYINNNGSTAGSASGVPAKEFSFFDEEETSDDIWSKEEE